MSKETFSKMVTAVGAKRAAEIDAEIGRGWFPRGLSVREAIVLGWL